MSTCLVLVIIIYGYKYYVFLPKHQTGKRFSPPLLDKNQIWNYIKNNTTNFRTRSNKAVARMRVVVLKTVG